jgi:hypothetical protein
LSAQDRWLESCLKRLGATAGARSSRSRGSAGARDPVPIPALLAPGNQGPSCSAIHDQPDSAPSPPGTSRPRSPRLFPPGSAPESAPPGSRGHAPNQSSAAHVCAPWRFGVVFSGIWPVPTPYARGQRAAYHSRTMILESLVPQPHRRPAARRTQRPTGRSEQAGRISRYRLGNHSVPADRRHSSPAWHAKSSLIRSTPASP